LARNGIAVQDTLLIAELKRRYCIGSRLQQQLQTGLVNKNKIQLPRMRSLIQRILATLLFSTSTSITAIAGTAFDAAPFGLPLPEGNGVMWEDPREIHRVVVHFASSPPPNVRLEYWGSRWPERHLPKDTEPGGGNIGWFELGNWYTFEWRVADAEVRAEGNKLTFTFRPVNAKEFPKLSDYPADFRFTLKLRVMADGPLPPMEKVEAYTDSMLDERAVRLVFDKPPKAKLKVTAFNGEVVKTERGASSGRVASSDGSAVLPPHEPQDRLFGNQQLAHLEVAGVQSANLGLENSHPDPLPAGEDRGEGEASDDSSRAKPATNQKASPSQFHITLRAVVNSDPNTFDRTLVTVRNGARTFTFKFDDLGQGPLYLPDLGAAVLPDYDSRDYATVAASVKALGAKTLYDRVAEMPEQTWRSAWDGMPPKKSRIYIPLGLDGGRQRFRLDADGGVSFRVADFNIRRRPGREKPRLALESSPVQFRFQLPGEPVFRTIEEESLPICHTTWERNGIRITQTAFVTELTGTKANGPVPPADIFAVFMAKFVLSNNTSAPQSASLPMTYTTDRETKLLRLGEKGKLWLGDNLRAQFVSRVAPTVEKEALHWSWTLAPGESMRVVVKIPYLVLTEKSEHDALAKLDFDTEQHEIAGYWRRRLDESARLITPEPMLNEFYRAHAGHLLINCEGDPDSTEQRFARVGSFAYGAFANESCMMVVDLERRGYHREAQECLDAWLHYQGTVALPGDFSTKKGVLYGAGGLEMGGYNQHHGWILWMLTEHYRFTRDEAWLRKSVPGLLAAADWILKETKRTADRHELERGLLPAGSLEDISDWWTWLSTSCYMWRGLDSAAWALEQIKHPEAQRIRAGAAAYHKALLDNFRKASERSPVVRLRDGTAVPHIPSMVHRRGRYFGWICETLEGSLHLLITGALDPRSPEAAWILKDYEDNRYLSNQYGYTLDDFDKYWFGRGGMSMQACLLLDVEPYLYRDDVKHALRAMFNGQAVSYFPDVRLNTEHALPEMGDWRGDHYKSSDESNSCGWLRYLFVREQGDTLLVGQAVPRGWLRTGQKCGIDRTSTWFGPASVVYEGGEDEITARLDGPTRNPPKEIRLRFREPNGRPLKSVTVNGKRWRRFEAEWLKLPGDIGRATIVARFKS